VIRRRRAAKWVANFVITGADIGPAAAAVKPRFLRNTPGCKSRCPAYTLAGAKKNEHWEEPLIKVASFTAAVLGGLVIAASCAQAKDFKVISDKAITGVGTPESVAYDPKEKVFYAGDFGGPEIGRASCRERV